MTSNVTKKYSRMYWLFLALSILANVCPLAVYTIKALINADLVTEKVTLCMTVLIVLILSIVSWVNKITLKSKLWIILIGLYICLKELMTPLIIIACCQILDELIICPIKNMYHSRLVINKEIDKRGA